MAAASTASSSATDSSSAPIDAFSLGEFFARLALIEVQHARRIGPILYFDLLPRGHPPDLAAMSSVMGLPATDIAVDLDVLEFGDGILCLISRTHPERATSILTSRPLGIGIESVVTLT